MINSKEWKSVIESLEKRKEILQKSINTISQELDAITLSKRSLFIMELNMIERFIQAPERVQDYTNLNEQYAKSQV